MKNIFNFFAFFVISLISSIALSADAGSKCGKIDVSVERKIGSETVVLINFKSKLKFDRDVSEWALGIDGVNQKVISDVFAVFDSKNNKIPYMGASEKVGRDYAKKFTTHKLNKGGEISLEVDIFDIYIRKPGEYRIKYLNTLSLSYMENKKETYCDVSLASNEINLKNSRKSKPIEIDGEIFE